MSEIEITAWIQAGVAVAIGVLTFFLVLYTRRYVAVMRDMASVAREQMMVSRGQMEQSREQRRIHFFALTDRLLQFALSLPAEESAGAAILAVSPLGRGEVAEYVGLASSVGDERAALRAADIADALNWLSGQVSAIQADPSSRISWDFWKVQRSNAVFQLARNMGLSDDVARRFAGSDGEQQGGENTGAAV